MEEELYEAKAASGKLVHIEHPEDESLRGKKGFSTAIHSLEKVHSALTHRKSGAVTTKYDGAPSVVFGHHPESGKFFVATKSAFNKDPKLNYSHADIHKNHESEGLRQKLSAALTHLPKVTPKKGVFQGDIMYTHHDVKKDHGGVHFKPNTITYSLHKDSDDAKKASKAKIGVVVHTHYKGKTMSDMTAHFDPDHKAFGSHKDAHIMNPGTDVSKSHYTPEAKMAYGTHMKRAFDLHQHMSDEGHAAVEKHLAHINTYINQTVREGSKPTFDGFKAHLKSHQAKDVESVSSQKSKTTRTEKWNAKINHAEENKAHIGRALAIHHQIQNAKNVLVHALSSHSPIGHSIDGKPSKPEGFVTTHKGKPIKLVDRGEFSRANLTATKSWKK